MKYLIIFGPPGAGKGTQSKLIAERYNYKHISTGQLLRQEIEKETETGKFIRSVIEKGEFVEDSLVLDIVKQEIFSGQRDIKGYIFDGFPRNLEQAIAFDNILDSTGKKIDAVLSLVIEENIIIERIQHRANIEGRLDDADFETIKKRIVTYHKVTEPLITYYKSQNKYFPVNGGLAIEKNFEEICKIIDTSQNG